MARAAEAGVELLALTDHDTVDGVREAADAATRHGMRLSPAAEITAVHDSHEDLHVLGYELSVDDPILRATLADWRADREQRVLAMADRLTQLGFHLDRTELDRRRTAGQPLGRPHLADAVLDHPANRARLQQEGIAGRDQLFPAYLVPGAPAYVPRTRPTVQEAIYAIHHANGVAVWAHPFWDVDDPLTTLARFAREGMDGVEAFYVTHTREQTLLLHDFASANGLLATGSSDFHSPAHERFSRFAAFELYGREPILGPIGRSGQ